MVFWLPLASLIVPSIVAVHDPTDPGLRRWVHRVAALQGLLAVVCALSLGFAIAAGSAEAGGLLRRGF